MDPSGRDVAAQPAAQLVGQLSDRKSRSDVDALRRPAVGEIDDGVAGQDDREGPLPEWRAPPTTSRIAVVVRKGGEDSRPVGVGVQGLQKRAAFNHGIDDATSGRAWRCDVRPSVPRAPEVGPTGGNVPSPALAPQPPSRSM